MKKNYFSLAMLFLGVILVSGCNSETKETVFEMPEDAQKKTQVQENMSSERKIDDNQLSESLNNAAANEFFKQGIEAAKNEDYQKALELFDSALELVQGTNKMKVLSNKASMLYNLGRYEESITIYDQIIELDPDFSEHYSNKGAALLKLGEYQDAVNLYNISLQKEAENFPALYNLACAYALQGDSAQAMNHLRQALAIRPEAKNFAPQDTDLQLLWEMPGFKTLIENTVIPEENTETE